MNCIVLFGCPSPIGGANSEAGHTVLLWRAAGIPVTVLPCHPIKADNPWPQRLADAGCRIEFPSLTGKPPNWLRDCLIVDFQARRAVQCWHELRRLGCKLIHVPCMNFTFDFERAAFRLDAPSAVVFQSEFQMQSVAMEYGSFGTPLDRHRLIRGAFDSTAFSFQPCERDAHFTVGVIGRDDPAKWPARIVSVLKAARKRMPTLRARFLGWTPAMQAHSGELPRWINHSAPGSIPAADFLSQCHCLLAIPSCTENWSRIVLESMAAGVPVVADGRGGFFEQVCHGETGFLAGNEQSAAECLLTLAEDEPLRLRIAKSARDSLCQIAPPEAIAEAWKGLFTELLPC
jgi:glycosyltransferase involved in cell wall biosynthesis